VCLFATAVFVWLVRRRIGALALWGAAYFFVTLLPILGLLSFGYLKHSPVGDQYVYPAALGFFLLVGLAVERLARWIGWRTAQFLLVPAGVAAVVGLGWLTWVRVPQWRGPVEFWSHTINRYPEFRFGRRRLADAYEIRGQLSEAADQYTRLLQDDPNDAQVHNNLGAALGALGRPAEALEHYRIAAERAAENDLAEVQPNLAACLRKLGLLSAEITRLRTALAREPEDAETRYALAAALGADGRIAEAIRHARQLVRDHPDDPHLLYRVAFLLRELRQDAAAAEAYRLAARQARAQNLAQLWYKINRELAGPTGAAAGD
jgi:tetratricopeptide (TPR) repeat protein